MHRGRLWYESLIIHQLSMLQCRPLHWWKGNLKPPIDSCRAVKLPSGPEWRTPYLSSGPKPNLFQREVMKKLIISNEELVIRARRNDCQHGIEESKRSQRLGSAKQYSLGTWRFSWFALSGRQQGLTAGLGRPIINLCPCHSKIFMLWNEREWILLEDNPVASSCKEENKVI